MKSTHNTLIAYAKGTSAAVVMAVGTALLMAWGAGHEAPLQNYSQQRLEAAAQSVPDQLVLLEAKNIYR